MFSPGAAANIAISMNHILWAIIGPIIVWSSPWDWPYSTLLYVVFVPLLVIDLVLWPTVYLAAKRDGWDPVSRSYRDDLRRVR